MKSTSGAGAEAKEVGLGTLFCNKRTPSKSVNMYLSKSPPPLPGLVIVMCPLLLPREGGDPGTESVVIGVLLMLDSSSTRNLSPASWVVWFWRPTPIILFADIRQFPSPVRARPVPIHRPVFSGQSVIAVISPDDEIILKRWTVIMANSHLDCLKPFPDDPDWEDSAGEREYGSSSVETRGWWKFGSITFCSPAINMTLE